MIDPPRPSLESWGSCSRGIYASIRVGMLVLNFPCATMTGAVIRAFMILTVSPVKAIAFLVFIVVLQQLEGNLIYPRDVGASLGLPAIWVLTAVTLGGGLLGIPGMLLRRRAQELVDLADKTAREFAARETELIGEIAIGAGETRSMTFLSQAIRTFREHYPKVTFRIFSANADDVKERLDMGLLDMGLLTEPVDVGKYAFCRMQEKDRWGVLVQTDSPLAELDAVTPQDLESAPLLVSGREGVQQELASWFGDHWDHLQIAATFNLILNAANMVRCGVGAALGFDLNLAFDGLRFLPLSPAMETGTVLVWKKDQVLTPAMEAFHQHIKNVQQAYQEKENKH